MDYLPLVLLAVVLVGAAVVFPFLRRLKRAARDTLAATKGLEARLQSFQAQQARQDQQQARPGGTAPPSPSAGSAQPPNRRDDPWG